MLNKKEVHKLPSIIYAYYVVFFTLWAFVLAIPFSIAGSYAGAFRSLFFILMVVYLIKAAQNRAVSFSFDDYNIMISYGIIFKQSKTIPFDKIQNVKISRGPLMRLFGISSIYIWTASQSQIVNSSKGETRPDGHLRLIKDDAHNLAETLLKKTIS